MAQRLDDDRAYMDLICGGCRLAIDFILAASLVTHTSILAGHAVRDLRRCMECGVKHIDVASDVRRTAYGAPHETVENEGTQYSPGDFLRQFAVVIATCLGMALLAHVLVAVVGGY